MKLTRTQITNFRCVEDSGVFEIGDLTCLVGKNEAGKTAILKALHGLSSTDGFTYDRTRDYPRRFLTRFNERHGDGKSPVAKTWWALEDDDVAELNKAFGEGALNDRVVEITSHIGMNGTSWDIPLNERKCLDNLASLHGLSDSEKTDLGSAERTKDAHAILKSLPERSPTQESLMQTLGKFREGSAIYTAMDILVGRKPKLFYASHFERMSGEISLNKLAADKQNNTVSAGDRIFLDFLECAGTTIEELRDATRYEYLVAQCEAASNDITDEIFQFWSQNEALAVKIDLSDGLPQDPYPFNSGRIAKIRIENQNHRISVPLSERSSGFVWFFSFLAQFKHLRKKAGKTIILLDEPGLTLHGKAQSDLLRYIESRVLPDHQIIYTTHSPYMVPVQRLADVRVVEDVLDLSDPRRPVVKGTKVSADLLSADKETLFPLQAHLEYEITQSLFVGQNCLLVDGPSDLIYLQLASKALQSRGRTGLDSRWTLCPSGGLDKVAPFASLFSENHLNIAALCDFGSGDTTEIERLQESRLLKAEQVLTIADFAGKPESGVEDLFDPALYCKIVNQALGFSETSAITTEKAEAVGSGSTRIARQVEALCKQLPPESPGFNRYLPAEWLIRHPELLDGDNPAVIRSLDRFEAVFVEFNQFL